MQVFPVRSEKKEEDEMNGQEQIVAWIGIDWADEAHEVWEYNGAELGASDIYAIKHSARIVAGMVEPTANPIRGKASSGGVGTGTWRADLCIDEHGFHGDLSGESAVVGEIPEGAISQWGEKRSQRMRNFGGNGSTKSGALSSVGPG